MKRLFVIVLVTLAGLTQIAQSQVRGIPPSVTSLAPGRPFLPGPSVTSLGPLGFDNGPDLLGNRQTFHRQRSFSGERRHAHPRIGTSGGVIYVPYAVPVYGMADVDPNTAVADTGATDATGYGLIPPSQLLATSPYAGVRAAQSAPGPSAAVSDPPQSKAVQAQPATVLVFKDGHQVQVTNYVIQGTTLFNLGGAGPRKIALSDLDVAATEAANDNQGVEFRLPQ
jgi:hypothetical protein